MSVPKGSRYTKGYGQMFKSTGRFGAVANRPLSAGQRGGTHVYNPQSGKYASLNLESVEDFLKEAPAKSKAQGRFMAHYYEEKEQKGEISKGEAKRKTEEWMAGTASKPEKVAALHAAIRQVAETYGVDLTQSNSVRRVPFILEKAAELLAS